MGGKGVGAPDGIADGPPEPLTPADSDLRDFRFMPLDVVRFAQSDLVAMEDPAAIVAAVLLWGASWHSLPAGSLTNDDRLLARAAGYGRGGAEWALVRDGAMRGWVECSDGRLYHPVVAEKVIDAWAGRLRMRHRSFCAAIRKHNERHPLRKIEAPSFEEWEAAGRPEKVTRDNGAVSHATIANVARDKVLLSQGSHAENHSKGEGQGRGTGDNTILASIGTGDSLTRVHAREGRG